MKKSLLILLASAGLSSMASAQSGVEIYFNGGATDVAGTTISLSPEGSETIVSDFHIENHTGVTKNWVITRTRINEKPTWVDFLCWGHETDPFGGTCYSSVTMNSTTWTATNAVVIADGEAGVLQSDITPDPAVDGCATYRYYVHEAGQPYEDSVDVEVCFTASLEQVAPTLTVGVAPNPATEYVNVTATGVEKATIKMVDVLGNVVLKETFMGSKKINVAEFRNGIYFIIVEADGVKPVSRKVIVRH